MKNRSRRWRKLWDLAIKIVSVSTSFLVVFFLFWILYSIIIKGIGAFNLNFFTALPTPPGIEGGGLANAILGTFFLTLIATAIGVPIGVLGGVYLAEFGNDNRLTVLVRFLANVLMGTPSIIIGVFIYTILVLPLHHFSGWAGAVALAIIMLPVVARTTEDMLSLVPNSLRESALALGATRWRTTINIVFRSAKTGMLTGVLLAIARVSGETAPLLFTAFNNTLDWPTTLTHPTANLTVTIFQYAMSPYHDWKVQAWGASLLITLVVLLLTIVSRVVIKTRES